MTKRDARTCLSYWFPRLKQSGVPIPKTSYVTTEVELVHLLDGVKPNGFEDFYIELNALVEQIGYPCFFRTGLGSDKHGWEKTCFLQRPEELHQKIIRLVEWSCSVDMWGLPYDVWVVREFLPIEPAFYAFRGNMPVNRERRYFFADGKIVSHIPYWHTNAFIRHKKPNGWRAMLEKINKETDEEVRELTVLTEQVMPSFKNDGAWALDWLWTKNGWYATDMGEAHRAWGCPEELQREA